MVAKSGRLEPKDNIYGQYSTTATYLANKEIEIGEKTQNKGYYAVQGHPMSSKGIEVDTNRKPVCDFLLVINTRSNLSYLVPFRRYRSLLFKFWTLCVFQPPFGGLETTYDVYLGLIEKRVVDFLLVIIELLSLGVTAEALRAKIDRK